MTTPPSSSSTTSSISMSQRETFAEDDDDHPKASHGPEDATVNDQGNSKDDLDELETDELGTDEHHESVTNDIDIALFRSLLRYGYSRSVKGGVRGVR
ncbi:hypothetical protein TrVE_jg14008 [Triparma verrucosa]|uniref:Uncharacterized protein n=1 Tax=Triparma verrucosa TaxID=1606542 RepID=A0A9W7FH45_9STRA|nr:hypothetical protein TrVE_jg14008 [Triparma verrucosa]